MNHLERLSCAGGIALACLAGAPAPAAGPVATGVTYQGRLLESGAPASGIVNMDFELFDAASGGAPIGPSINLDVAIGDDGRFTVTDLDFGAGAYDGGERWLQVSVDGVPLTPRHEMSPAPYAMRALNAPFEVSPTAVWLDGNLALGTDAPEAIFSIENVGGVDGAMLMNFSENDNPEFFLESGFAGTGTGNFMRLNSAWANVMTWFGNGRTGIRETDPQAQLHVTETEIALDPNGLSGEDLIVEDNDAVLGLYSNEGGSAGSGVALGEITDGAFIDKWGITRETTGAGAGLRFSYNTTTDYFGNPVMRLAPNGDLGLGTGTSDPLARLDVFTDDGAAARFESTDIGLGAPAVHLVSHGEASGHSTLRVTLEGGLFAAGIFEAENATGIYAEGTRAIWTRSTGVHGLPLIVEGYGSQTPNNLALFNNGGFAVARIDGTGRGFFNGGTQTGGADVAEAFAVEGDLAMYEPGDVLVISTTIDRTVAKSAEAYSTLVAGVYATKPGVLLTERTATDPLDDLVPMGVVGVIPTKVSAENGPIARGDLLVTSATRGHAMKGTERDRLVGAIVGKALEAFDGPGTGVIKVMVNVK